MSPIDNSSNKHDLCNRLKEIEELPIERELKVLMQLGAVLSNWTEDVKEILEEHIEEQTLDQSQRLALDSAIEHWYNHK